MPANLGTESTTVQHPLTRYAGQAGWTILSKEEATALRRGESGMFFYDLLKAKLQALNPGVITSDLADDVIHRLESVRNNIEGNSEILAWLRGERSVYVEAEKRQRNVTLIDFSDTTKNHFHVTEEWQYTNGTKTNRADDVFLINGIPVALVECKSAKKHNAMEEALTQVRRYHKETPEMVTAPQVFDFSHLIEFFYGVTWNLDRKNIFPWKMAPSPGGEGRGEGARFSYEAKVKTFFEPRRILDMLKDWILFFVKDDELQKTVLRQHQTRTAQKVVVRCADHAKKTGLVWHTQGSGKTFTMITAARLILERQDVFGKATVLLVIDRNELEGQLMGWVERLLGELQSRDIKIEHANTKARLVELLRSDFRGLIVTMIHKFDSADKNLSTRKNVFALIDEAHRSTGGDLGNYLLAALPNATLIGFTGTPIDLTAYGKGTFKVFGKEDEQGYLDKYSIAESIEDGTTLPLRYTHAPNEICLPENLLEDEFLKLAQAEGIADVEDLNRILDRAVKLKAFLKSNTRVKAVAKFVAEHFKTKVQPLGYKAFLVAVDREACALYKQELDKHLPPDWSAPIYIKVHNDPEKLPIVAKYQLGETDEKTARLNFPKPDQQPEILIITDKLLTGYDAPVLFCMYLDKPMRDHVLLQAIARVNRPFEEQNADGGDRRKPCGVIVDFVGILGKLKKALAFDSKDVSGLVENLDVLFSDFVRRMTGPAKDYLALAAGKMDDKAVEKAIDAFEDKKKREAFYKFFKELEQLYEILSPAAALYDYIDDYTRLATLYEVIRNAYGAKTTFLGDVAKKTEMLIRGTASYSGLVKTTKPVVIDADTLARLRDSQSSDTNKVINLAKGIQATVNEKGTVAPYLITIGERAEAIREQYDERQVTTEEARQQLDLLANEAIEAEKAKRESGLDDATFPLYWELKRYSYKDPKILAVAISAPFRRFPNFSSNPDEMRQLKAELYKLLLPLVQGKKMVEVADRLIKVSTR
ncbi:MAG TPA: HsdR family type I site-specific deoxyribonuclease [Verrucomicrobiae bacterium]